MNEYVEVTDFGVVLRDDGGSSVSIVGEDVDEAIIIMQGYVDKRKELALTRTPIVLGGYNDIDSWKYEVAEYLDDAIRERTPHGRRGGSIVGVFLFDGKNYRVTYDPDWNRHDKQFYFIDNYEASVDKCQFKEAS